MQANNPGLIELRTRSNWELIHISIDITAGDITNDIRDLVKLAFPDPTFHIGLLGLTTIILFVLAERLTETDPTLTADNRLILKRFLNRSINPE